MNELRKILHVDDDPDIQVITLIALESLGGFEVRQCSSGLEAIEVAPVFQPDLFLLDVMMPHMSGPETLHELRKQQSFLETPAIFLTAKAQPEEIEAYMKVGAIDVITKPFDAAALSVRISESWTKSFEKQTEPGTHSKAL